MSEIDRNKVIDGLFTCTRPILCRYCPYRGENECVKHMMSDAFELLKADKVDLISQKDRIETLERIVDHMKDSIKRESTIFEDTCDEEVIK